MTDPAAGAAGAGDTGAGDAAAQQAAADAAAAAAAGDTGAGDGENPWADPEKAKREIERLRRENGDARINAKKAAAEEGAETARKQLLSDITKALGIETGSDQLTPEQLTEKLTATGGELTETQGKLAATTAELAALKAAWQLGVDPAQVDYLNYQLGKSADFRAIDITAADAGDKLNAVISDLIAKDSRLKLSGAAIGSGAESFGGANSATATMTKAQWDALPYSERVSLYQTNRSEYDRLNSLK